MTMAQPRDRGETVSNRRVARITITEQVACRKAATDRRGRHVPDVPYGAGHPALGSPKQRVEDSHRRTGGSTASRSWTPSGQSLLCRKPHRGGAGVQAGANMIGHGIRQAIAEGLALGVKAGVEPEAL